MKAQTIAAMSSVLTDWPIHRYSSHSIYTCASVCLVLLFVVALSVVVVVVATLSAATSSTSTVMRPKTQLVAASEQ